jgi:hypothetical protein
MRVNYCTSANRPMEIVSSLNPNNQIDQFIHQTSRKWIRFCSPIFALSFCVLNLAATTPCENKTWMRNSFTSNSL